MPIYEYRCESCEHEFEKLVRAGESEPEDCPDCREPSLERLVSNTNFKLKGSGWYETDYAQNDDEAAEGEQKEGADEAGDTDSEAAETTDDE